ncbi:hypothetical protein M977_00434 [Buttiauxella gaviniae ATCC 51604]|uniref:Uncharacterized protein n=1 Tax=Buttiauxella gaviniae ATCC 51604 TaxID=1354253 RepID=A0A1B7I532_9ENTR|nr:HNH endonuclease [Buttiauxella gaviniae]OAT23525.1 hypothetical protein M977_00434 [Buttiauxella gaviniae ATCC 51604]
MRDNFSTATVSKLAERAAYVCSHPTCNRLTIGPDQACTDRSIKTGEAAHICAASSNGPRYDMSQTTAERKSINNAIWLCATCSDLIDKNNGLGYEASELRKWKRDHETLIKDCLEGGKRMIFGMIQGGQLKTELKIAERIVHILEDKGCLYMDYLQEDPTFVADSLKELRVSLSAIRAEVDSISPLSVIIQSIIAACRYYMNNTSTNPDIKELNYSLGAVRKIIGLNLNQLLSNYDIPVNDNLSSLLPKS